MNVPVLVDLLNHTRHFYTKIVYICIQQVRRHNTMVHILPDKLIVTQLVKKCSDFYRNPSFTSVVTKPAVDPILIQLNPDHILTPFSLYQFEHYAIGAAVAQSV
jgi:hypothetical protein